MQFSEDSARGSSPKLKLIWGLVVLAALVCAGLAGFYILEANRPAADRATEALVKALDIYRLVEPRLSGGFKAAAFAPSRDQSLIDSEKLKEASELIEPEVIKGNDPRVQLAWGRLLLIQQKLPMALGALRMAVEQMPASAEAHNDLGACLYERNKYEEALKEFDQASNIDPQMREARFNRALCYRQLELRSAAKDEYEKLLAIETDQKWRDEIGLRLAEVSDPLKPAKKSKVIVKELLTALEKSDTDAARKIVDENFEDILIVRSDLSISYLKALIEGKQALAESSLSSLRQIGQLAAEIKGDHMISDTADYIASIAPDRRASELDLIREYRKEEELINASTAAGEQARKRMKELSKIFLDGKNYVFYEMVTAALMNWLYDRDQYDRVVEEGKEVSTVIARHKWPYEQGWVYAALSQAASRLGQYSLSIKYGEQALEIRRQLGVKRNVAKDIQQLGFAYGQLGNLSTAISRLRESLKLAIETNSNVAEISFNLLEIADYYRIRGDENLALLYANEARGYALMGSDDKEGNTKKYARNYAIQALSLAAIELAQLDRIDEAKQYLEQSFSDVRQLGKDLKMVTGQHVYSRAAEMALKDGNIDEALRYYNDAEAMLDSADGNTLMKINLLQKRAGAYAKKGDAQKAHADLIKAIGLIEESREQIASGPDRSQYLSASQSVFDKLISLDVASRERWPFAFAISEQSRARLLTEEMALKHATLGEVQAGLPPGLTILQYSVTDQGTYIFLISRSQFDVAVTPTTTEQLDRLVDSYLIDLKDKVDPAQLNKKAKELYQHLIAPVELQLNFNSKVCIVPDKALHFLPFPALVDNSNRYLIESFTLTCAPSSTVLLSCINEDRKKVRKGPEKFFAVGDPSFDPEEFKHLKPLPDAVNEVIRSASYYSKKEVLKRTEATEDLVREKLRDCDVAHLALHCLVEEDSPWVAALVLASKDGTAASALSSSKLIPAATSTPSIDGKLYFKEVYGLAMTRTRLVVLSACQSGIGQYYRGEGMVSIVRPFLAAHVPMVVASLWQVDSRSTSELMIEFHKQRKEADKPTADALRAAQLRLAVGDNKHPYYWAPFIAVGSNN